MPKCISGFNSLPAGLVPDITVAIVHNYTSGFNSLPTGLVPDMTDTIVHNYTFGFNSLPAGLAPDMIDVYWTDIRLSNKYTLVYPVL